jgi:hypothetical protein
MRKVAWIIIPLAGLLAAGCQKTTSQEKPTPPTEVFPERTVNATAGATTVTALAAAPSPLAAGSASPAQSLRISRIENAWLSQTRAPQGTGVCWAFYSAENTVDERGRWGFLFDSDSVWMRHTDLDSAPVALLIYQNSHPVDVRDGDYVTVRHDGGKTVRIYPPALSGVNGTFYVSSQGETYLDRELTRPARAAPASE